MTRSILFAGAAALTLAACGAGGDGAQNQAATDNMSMGNMSMDNMSMDNMAMDNGMAAGAAAPANGQEYATMAAASDMFEIESSQLAVEKSQNAQVREFAQMLVADHRKSTADLKAAAGRAQPPIDVAPQLNEEQQSNMAALRAASAADFDRTYLSQQVPAHEKALAMVQGYAQNGDVEAFKQHASTVAGPIQRHLQRAQELQASAGASR